MSAPAIPVPPPSSDAPPPRRPPGSDDAASGRPGDGFGQTVAGFSGAIVLGCLAAVGWNQATPALAGYCAATLLTALAVALMSRQGRARQARQLFVGMLWLWLFTMFWDLSLPTSCSAVSLPFVVAATVLFLPRGGAGAGAALVLLWGAAIAWEAAGGPRLADVDRRFEALTSLVVATGTLVLATAARRQHRAVFGALGRQESRLAVSEAAARRQRGALLRSRRRLEAVAELGRLSASLAAVEDLEQACVDALAEVFPGSLALVLHQDGAAGLQPMRAGGETPLAPARPLDPGCWPAGAADGERLRGHRAPLDPVLAQLAARAGTDEWADGVVLWLDPTERQHALVVVVPADWVLGRGDLGFVQAMGNVLAARRVRDQVMHDRARLAARVQRDDERQVLGRRGVRAAQDHNNYLSVVMSTLEALAASPAVAGAHAADLAALRELTQDAAQRTHQFLLASMGDSAQAPVAVPAAVVQEAAGFLRRLAGANTRFALQLGAEGAAVLADADELAQILQSLVAAARASLPAGGQVRIETALGRVEGEQPVRAAPREVTSGGHDTGADHVLVTVRSSPVVPAGAGAVVGSLPAGLALVRAILARRGGCLGVGHPATGGLVLTAALPRVEARPADIAPPRGASRGQVLLVEDEPELRSHLARHLRRAGYAVWEAGAPDEAWVRFHEAGEGLSGMVTDIRLGGASGVELVAALRATGRPLPVLYITGYAEPEQLRVAREEGVLIKPFRIGRFIEAVDGMLGQRRVPAPEPGRAAQSRG